MPPEIPDLPGVRHSYVDAGGLRVHVAEAGDAGADPVVMLHGWPQHWWCWRKLIPPLAERYRVICPDLRGHGWSDAPEDGYGKQQFATDLLATLDALGLDRVRLVGHDWGAMTGFLACIREPARFDRFLALGILPPFPNPDPKRWLQIWRAAYQIPLTAPVIAPRLVSRPGFLRMFIRAGMHRKDAATRSDLDLYADVLAERPHVTLGIYRTFIRREFLELANGRWAGPLDVPTVVMLGAKEPVASPSLVKGHERWTRDMRVEELPGVGHFSPEEAPDEVLAGALELFAR